jgi:hypothetical protein
MGGFIIAACTFESREMTLSLINVHQTTAHGKEILDSNATYKPTEWKNPSKLLLISGKEPFIILVNSLI